MHFSRRRIDTKLTRIKTLREKKRKKKKKKKKKFSDIIVTKYSTSTILPSTSIVRFGVLLGRKHETVVRVWCMTS